MQQTTSRQTLKIFEKADDPECRLMEVSRWQGVELVGTECAAALQFTFHEPNDIAAATPAPRIAKTGFTPFRSSSRRMIVLLSSVGITMSLPCDVITQRRGRFLVK